MKIGVLGGTFNPIHNAHMQMARIARDALSLDRVLLMVAADPPHKDVNGHIAASHRYEMTRLAAATAAHVEACDLEIRRGGKSYMADTLATLRKENPDASLYLIVGSDMLCDITTWYHPERIAALAGIAAITRHGQEAGDEQAADQLRTELSARVHLLHGDADRLSSTEVRDRLEAALPVSGMLPPCVERYCYETGLYFPPDVQDMQRRVRAAVNEKRYLHTMGTVRAAIELAARWHADTQKARIAALLHDCAKCLDPVTLEVLGGDDTGIGSVQHAFAGAVVAHNAYGIADQAILRAIRLHSTGDANMTTLDALLYLADLTEPNRSFPAVEALRSDIGLGEEQAMLTALLRVRERVKEMCREGTEIRFHSAGDRAIQYYQARTENIRKEKKA